MGWLERAALAALVLALFAPFYFLVTRDWHAAVVLLVYAALAPGVVQGAVSAYERYDVRCWAKAFGLRRALARGEIVLYYQPKVEIETGKVVSAEALVRWEHPRRGTLPPAQFLATAQRTALAKRFDLHVIASAIRQGRAWQLNGMPLTLCVNVTPAVLAQPEFALEVGAMLVEADYPPKLLDLEVTESVFADSSALVDPLEQLAALGVRLTLDDFGTGHSSMRRVVDLPIDVIKVDRSFVLHAEQPANSAVIQTTAALAHTLGRKVCAEGIETEEAWHRARALGCDVAQGYLLARPMPASEFADWIQNWDTGGRDFVEALREGTA